MRKYFELQLDLLDIPNKKEYLNIADIIEQNLKSKFEIYHQYAFIFEWYQKLLNWEITEEEFTQLWDFQSKIKLNPNKLDSISFLQQSKKLDSDTIYIFDSLAKWIVEESNNIFYC